MLQYTGRCVRGAQSFFGGGEGGSRSISPLFLSFFLLLPFSCSPFFRSSHSHTSPHLYLILYPFSAGKPQDQVIIKNRFAPLRTELDWTGSKKGVNKARKDIGKVERRYLGGGLINKGEGERIGWWLGKMGWDGMGWDGLLADGGCVQNVGDGGGVRDGID